MNAIDLSPYQLSLTESNKLSSNLILVGNETLTSYKNNNNAAIETINDDIDATNLRITNLNIGQYQLIISENNKVIEFIKDPTRLCKNIPTSTGFIPCTSAFGGMALYKTKAIKDKTYNGDETCEHISFHKGLKMYINSEFISG